MPGKTTAAKEAIGGYPIKFDNEDRVLLFNYEALAEMERQLEIAGFARSINAIHSANPSHVSMTALAIGYHCGFLHEKKEETINDIGDAIYNMVGTDNNTYDLIWLKTQLFAAIQKVTPEQLKENVLAAKKFVETTTGKKIKTG